MINIKKIKQIENEIIKSDEVYEVTNSSILINLFDKKVELLEKELNLMIESFSFNFTMKLEDFYSDNYELHLQHNTSIEMKKKVKNLKEIYFTHFNQLIGTPITFIYEIKDRKLYLEDNKLLFNFFINAPSTESYHNMSKLIENISEDIKSKINKNIITNLEEKINNLILLNDFYYINNMYKKNNLKKIVDQKQRFNISEIKEYIEILVLNEDYIIPKERNKIKKSPMNSL